MKTLRKSKDLHLTSREYRNCFKNNKKNSPGTVGHHEKDKCQIIDLYEEDEWIFNKILENFLKLRKDSPLQAVHSISNRQSHHAYTHTHTQSLQGGKIHMLYHA